MSVGCGKQTAQYGNEVRSAMRDKNVIKRSEATNILNRQDFMGLPQLLLGSFLLLAVVLGCGGGQTCTAELTVEGKVYKGTDKDAEQAETNACNGYCIEGDPDFDIAFHKWLETPESKDVPDRNNKWTGQYKSKELRSIADRCMTRCKEFAKDGVFKMNVKCS